MDRIYTSTSQITNCADGSASNDGASCLTNIPQVSADSGTLTDILSIVFGVMSAVAVIIIVVQAIKFVLSAGDPDKVANARKGIIYALVGLVISLSANAIVVFVLARVFE